MLKENRSWYILFHLSPKWFVISLKLTDVEELDYTAANSFYVHHTSDIV